MRDAVRARNVTCLLPLLVLAAGYRRKIQEAAGNARQEQVRAAQLQRICDQGSHEADMPANGAAVWAVLRRKQQAEHKGGPQVEAAAECCLMRGSV